MVKVKYLSNDHATLIPKTDFFVSPNVDEAILEIAERDPGFIISSLEIEYLS